MEDVKETLAEKPAPKKGKSLIQLIKFALVGASNTIVDMVVNTGLSYVLNLFFKGGWIVYAAKAVGYLCGLLNSYFLNSRGAAPRHAGEGQLRRRQRARAAHLLRAHLRVQKPARA